MTEKQGLQALSFEQAARSYARAVDGRVLTDSVRRVSQGFGQQVGQVRLAEAGQAYDMGPGSDVQSKPVKTIDPRRGEEAN